MGTLSFNEYKILTKTIDTNMYIVCVAVSNVLILNIF